MPHGSAMRNVKINTMPTDRQSLERDGEVVSHQAHNLKAEGSIPSLAISHSQLTGKD